MHSQQSVFNTVAAAIIAQGVPSIDENDACVYRGLNGLKCAAGHLLPDDEYDPKMEGTQASWIAKAAPSGPQLVPISPTLAQIVDATSIVFLNRLQMAHDNAALDGRDFLDQYRERMTTLAEIYGLNTDALA